MNTTFLSVFKLLVMLIMLSGWAAGDAPKSARLWAFYTHSSTS